MKKDIPLLLCIVLLTAALRCAAQTDIPERETTSARNEADDRREPFQEYLSIPALPSSGLAIPALGGYSLPSSLPSSLRTGFPATPALPRLTLPDGTARLSEKGTVFGRGSEILYPGFDGMVSIEGGMEWRLHRRLTVRTSAFTLNQFTPFSNFPAHRTGTALSLHYQAGERVEFDAWGRIMLPEGSVAPGFRNPMLFPQTGVGGAATLKIGNNLRIGVSAEYYKFDPNIDYMRHRSGGNVRFGF